MANTKEQKAQILIQEIQGQLDSVTYQINGDSMTVRGVKGTITTTEKLIKSLCEVLEVNEPEKTQHFEK